LGLLSSLSAGPDLWKTQNIYFTIGKKLYGPLKNKADGGDDLARRWVEVFSQLGSQLHVKVF
jgi:hypothetical protein